MFYIVTLTIMSIKFQFAYTKKLIFLERLTHYR